MIGLFQNGANAQRVKNLGRELRHAPINGKHIGFLKTDLAHFPIALQAMRCDLAGQHQCRDRVIERAADARQQVCRTGTTGNYRRAQISRQPGIAIGRHRRALLVSDECDSHAVFLARRIKQVNRRTARHAKNVRGTGAKKMIDDVVG